MILVIVSPCLCRILLLLTFQINQYGQKPMVEITEETEKTEPKVSGCIEPSPKSSHRPVALSSGSGPPFLPWARALGGLGGYSIPGYWKCFFVHTNEILYYLSREHRCLGDGKKHHVIKKNISRKKKQIPSRNYRRLPDKYLLLCVAWGFIRAVWS